MKTQSFTEGLHTMIKREAFLALLAVGMTVVSSNVVHAQSIVSKEGFFWELRKKSIVGSWEELVRFPSGVPIPQQRSVMSFHDDGTDISTGQGGVIFNTDPAKATVESDGLGAWVQLDWHTFGYTNKAVFSDLNGNLTGFFKVRGIYKLDGSGDTYRGNSYYEFLDKDMKPVIDPNSGQPVAGWVCNDGVRIRVESPPTQPPPPEHCVPPEQP
jgi:hypothetical protein